MFEALNKYSYTKLAAAYNLEDAEIASEAWLIKHDNPEINDSVFYSKLRSRCIELTKTAGLSRRGSVQNNVENDNVQHEAFLHAPSVLEVLEEFEKRAILEKKIESLDSLSRERIEIISACRNGSEVAEKLNLKKRHANETIRKWCKEAEDAANQVCASAA